MDKLSPYYVNVQYTDEGVARTEFLSPLAALKEVFRLERHNYVVWVSLEHEGQILEHKEGAGKIFA
jgi:hypothetical protein